MNPAAALLLFVALFAGAGYASVRLFPWKTCPSCKGGRRIQGGGGIHRDCGRCGATGRMRRWGAGKEK